MLAISKGLLEDLYWRRWFSTREIAKMIGKSQATVRKMMLRLGIPLRSKGDWLPVRFTRQMLWDLYWNNRMTIQQIAKRFGVSGWTVHQRMIKFGIPRRGIGEANLKQTKLFFSNIPTERAYMLGLRAGDLSARWKGKRVRVEICTTHPALLELFKSVFGKYSHVGICPERHHTQKRIFQWRAFVDLDASFSFLVEKPESIEPGILSNDDLFLAFLAGYADADGSFIVSHVRAQVVCIFRICSQDLGLLRNIREKLFEMGYHPTLTLEAKKGVKKGYSTLKADYWRLELSRKNEVPLLVQRLPIMHFEKRRKRELMLDIKDKMRWLDVKDKVLTLRARIKEEVKKFIQEAELAFRKKHNLKIPIIN